MSDSSPVRLERHGAVAVLVLDRADRRNALSRDTLYAFGRRGRELVADDSVRAIVITGSGDKAFCAGADLGTMADGASYADLHDARGELALLFRDLWELGKPTVARVRGYALAGGFGVALACDLVVAADDAQFGAPEIDLGLWPHMITVPLTRSMPPKKALELMMTGRRVGADEAAAIGFVNRVVPVADLDTAVDELAATLAAKPPGAMKLGRNAFYGSWDLAAEDALRLLHPLLTVTASTEEAAEGIAAFQEKRKPSWT